PENRTCNFPCLRRSDKTSCFMALRVQPKCVACKMALMSVQNKSPTLSLKRKLYNACTYMEDLRAVCKRFVKKHLQELIKGLKTNEDVETICINAKACK
uniref:Saposin B-type domain-containing protein n=1 Tax=Gouania willdenowi TaxID=441366 RepID=A0A8C5GV64_GOUWI